MQVDGTSAPRNAFQHSDNMKSVMQIKNGSKFTAASFRLIYSTMTICLYCYGASEASVVFRRLTEISEYERPAGRPADRGHAFVRLIAQQPLDRCTCDNFCGVASSLLPTTEQKSMHVGDL